MLRLSRACSDVSQAALHRASAVSSVRSWLVVWRKKKTMVCHCMADAACCRNAIPIVGVILLVVLALPDVR